MLDRLDDVPQMTLVVDVANVMGSRPDGWWRDRAGAATRWLADLDRLVGRSVTVPSGRVIVTDLVAVIEGRARDAKDPDPAALRVVRAVGDGDTTIVAIAEQSLARAGTTSRSGVEVPSSDKPGSDKPGAAVTLVVTADRGLRDRLPPGVMTAGPGWLRQVLG
jgi:hypothetical protein